MTKHILDSPYFRKMLRLLFTDDMYARLKKFYKDVIVSYGIRETLDEEFRYELMTKFKPEVEKISELLDRDFLALWGYGKI